MSNCRAADDVSFRLADNHGVKQRCGGHALGHAPGGRTLLDRGHNRQSTHADTPPCGISSCSKRPIWHNIRSSPNSRVVPGTSVLANLNARCPGVSNEVSSDWCPVGVSELPTCGLRSI